MQNQIKREIAFESQLKTALEQHHIVIFGGPRRSIEEFPIAETTRETGTSEGSVG